MKNEREKTTNKKYTAEKIKKKYSIFICWAHGLWLMILFKRFLYFLLPQQTTYFSFYFDLATEIPGLNAQ